MHITDSFEQKPQLWILCFDRDELITMTL